MPPAAASCNSSPPVPPGSGFRDRWEVPVGPARGPSQGILKQPDWVVTRTERGGHGGLADVMFPSPGADPWSKGTGAPDSAPPACGLS